MLQNQLSPFTPYQWRQPESTAQQRSKQIEIDSPGTSEGPLRIAAQVMKRLLTSTVHGFTTINIDRSIPETTAEGIAQSIGMWIGITGSFVPIAGKVGLGIRASSAAVRSFATATGRRMGIRGTAEAGESAWKLAGQARRKQVAETQIPGRWTSAPIWLGDRAMEGFEHMARRAASPGVKRFARAHTGTADVLKGGVRIGTAMGVTGWQEGFEGMAWGAGFGMFFGTTDRFIGNTIRTMRPRIQAQFKSTQVPPGASEAQKVAAKARLEQVERGISMISAGIVSGSPSTLMGMPWEYQLYDYMFGAWLGAEPPYHRRVAHQFVDQMRVTKQGKLMGSAKDLYDTPEHKALMKRHTNKRVRRQINEEIEAQVLYRFGQMMHGWASMAYIMQTVRDNYKNMTKEEIAEMDAYLNELAVSGRAYDMAYEFWTGQGLKEGAAHEAAMINTRDAYSRFMEGKTPTRSQLGIDDSIRAWRPNQDGFQVMHPTRVKIDGQWIVGVVTRTDSQGRAIEVIGKDGTILVSAEMTPKGRGLRGKRATPKGIKLQQQDSRWKMTQFTEGQFAELVTRETPGDLIPLSLWSKFPNIRDKNLRTVKGENAQGDTVLKVTLGQRTLFQSSPYAGRIERSDRFVDFRSAQREAFEYRMKFTEAETVQRMTELDASEIWRVAREFDDGTTLKKIESIREVAKKINIAEGTDDISSIVRTYSRLREIYQSLTDDTGKIKKHIEHPWDVFINQASESFPVLRTLMAEDPDALAGIRNWFRRAQYAEPKVKYAWRQTEDGNWVFAKLEQTYYDGKPASETKAPSFMQRVLRTKGVTHEIIHIDRVEGVQTDKQGKGVRNYSRRLSKAVHKKGKDVTGVDESHFYQMTWYMFTNPKDFGGVPYYIMGGVKDKDTLRGLPMLFRGGDDARTFLKQRIDQLGKEGKRLLKSRDPEKKRKGKEFLRFQKEYLAERKTFIKDIQQHVDMGADDVLAMNLRKVEDLFDMMFASEIRTWEWMHSDITSGRKGEYPLTHVMRSEGFMHTATERNKRMQIIDAEGMQADPSFYTDIKGVEDGSVKALFINTVNRKKGLTAVKGLDDETMWVRDKDGKLQRVPDEALRDGFVIVHPALFRRMGQDVGVSDFGSAIKGFTAFSDSKGMFLGKYAMFEGTQAAARTMDEHGALVMYYTSAAKVIGQRASYDMQVDGDRTRFYNAKGVALDKPTPYNIPLSAITFTAGKADIIGKALGRQRLAVQLLQSLSTHLVDSNVTRAIIDDLTSSATRSTHFASTLMTDLMRTDMAKLDHPVREKLLKSLSERVDKIDVEEIGIRDLEMVMKGEGLFVEAGLYDKVVRHIMKQVYEAGDIDRTTTIDEVHDTMFHRYRGASDIIMSTADRYLTPALLESRGIYHLFQQMKGDYFYKRLARPHLDYSMKSILSGHDPWTMQSYGNIAEGTFMLGQGSRNMRVYSEGKATTLGKLWDSYTQARDRAATLRKTIKPGKEVAEELRALERKLKTLEHDLDMVIARVPIDHAAGVRALRFAGFSDDVGTTSRLHPYDMFNLGGADVDIDDIFIYQNLGKEYVTGRDGKKTSLIEQLRKPEVKDRWLAETPEGKRLRTELKSDEAKEAMGIKEQEGTSMATMFSPRANYNVARRTAEANKNVGIVADARRDITAYMDMMSRGVHETYATERLVAMESSKKRKAVLTDLERKGYKAIRFRVLDGEIGNVERLLAGALNLMVDASNYAQFGDIHTSIGKIFSRGVVIEAAKTRSSKKWIRVDLDVTTTPIFSQMKRAAKFFKGRDHTNERKYDFIVRIMHLQDINSQFHRTASEATGGNIQSLADVPGSFYRAAQTMATQIGTDLTPFDNAKIPRLKQVYEIYNKMMGEDSSIGNLVAHVTSQLKNFDIQVGQRDQSLADQQEWYARQIAEREGRTYDDPHLQREAESVKKRIADDLKLLNVRHRKVTWDMMVKSIEAYNRILIDPDARTYEKVEAYMRMKDFLANDLADMVSAIAIYRQATAIIKADRGKLFKANEEAPPGVIERMQRIAMQITDMKYNWYHIMRKKRAETDSARSEAEQELLRHPYQTKEAIEQAVADLRADIRKMVIQAEGEGADPKRIDMLTEQYQKFFDYYAMSTFVSRSYDTSFLVYNPFFAHLSNDNAREFYKIYELFYRTTTPRADVLRERRIYRLLEAKDTELEQLLHAAKRSGTVNRRPITHTVENIKRRYREHLKEKPDAPTGTRSIPAASKAHHLYWTSPEFQEAYRKWQPTDRDKQIIAELTRFFNEHPNALPVFESIFQGIQSHDLGRQHVYRIEDASYEDMMHVLGVLKGYRHGNLLAEISKELPREIDWTMYYLFPNRYHERLARHDLLFRMVKGGVVNRDGSLAQENMLVLTSTPDILHRMADNASLLKQPQHKKWKETFMLGHDAMFGANDPADLQPIYRHVVFQRKLREYARHQDPFFAEGDQAVEPRTWLRNQAEKARKAIDALHAEGRVYKITDADGTVREVDVNTIINELDTFLTKHFTDYINEVIMGGEARAVYEVYSDAELGILDLDVFFARLQNNLQRAIIPDIQLPGFDLMHRAAHQYMHERRLIKEGYRKENLKEFNTMLSYRMAQSPIKSYTKIDPDTYFPQTNYDPAHAKAIARQRFKEMVELGMSKEMAEEIVSQEYGFLNDTSSSGNREFNEFSDLLLNVSEDIRIETVERLRAFEIPDVLLGVDTRDARTYERIHIGGWDTDMTAVLTMQDKVTTAAVDKALGLASAKAIDDFQVRMQRDDPASFTKEGRNPFADFMRLFVRDQVGTTTELPRSWYDAYPELGVRRSKYGMFTDTYWRRLDLKIAKKLNTRPLLQENNPDRTWRLVSLANAEAKYALMTLLSRPKALFTNLYGGNELTAIDVGLATWFRVFNIKQLQRLDPRIKTVGDAMRLTEQHGAMESLIYSEVRTSPHWKNQRYRMGLEEAIRKIKADPELSDTNLWAILRKHNIPDVVIRAAAGPMRYSERFLRTHAFLAHVLKHADTMENIGSPFKNEWIMEMARRGVVSSQFLYNNANRPAFARTNMGKIFSRFKLWAWNSVQFRTLTVQRAAEVGYQKGTEQYKRMERMLLADMFMFALASLFPFTLFATALPEPYGWLKDLVQWGFGDDEEKSKTFFGALPPKIAPLNMALPASSRVLTTWFQPMLSGEWDQFAGYHVWSFFPFGLMARDTRRSIQRPQRAFRQLSGIPAGELMDNVMSLPEGQSKRRASIMLEDEPKTEPDF